MKDIIAQTAGRLVEEIFNTIEKVGLSNVGKTAEELFAVLKNGTLEVLAAAIGEMDAAVLSAKKERKGDSGSYPRFKEQKGTRKGSQRPEKRT